MQRFRLVCAFATYFLASNSEGGEFGKDFEGADLSDIRLVPVLGLVSVLLQKRSSNVSAAPIRK
jgi:hypothetical protein